MSDGSAAALITAAASILGVALGYALKLFGDYLSHSRAVEREREARDTARQDRLYERRVAFQRETLLALQQVILDLCRAAIEAYHLDLQAFRKSGFWGKELLPDELDERSRSLQAKAGLLLVRVHDEQIRAHAEQIKQHAAVVAFGRNQVLADQAIAKMQDAFQPLNDRIGEVLRELDTAEQ